MSHQVLCIEQGSGTSIFQPKKGEIYNSMNVIKAGVEYNGLDAWHELEEGAVGDLFHVCMFVDLPESEGQTFSKEKDEPVEIKKEELVEVEQD